MSESLAVQKKKILWKCEQSDAAQKACCRPHKRNREPEEAIQDKIQGKQIEKLQNEHEAKAREARHWIEHHALEEAELVKQIFVSARHSAAEGRLRLTRRS